MPGTYEALSKYLLIEWINVFKFEIWNLNFKFKMYSNYKFKININKLKKEEEVFQYLSLT